MELVVLVPVLGRPQNVAPLLDSLGEATPIEHKVLFLLSPNDTATAEVLWSETYRVEGQVLAWSDVPWMPGPGDFARKINRGYLFTKEPFIFTGADDLKFHPGWFEAARAWMDQPNVGVVGTNDLGNPKVVRGYHSTHSLVRREYADKMGTIDGPGAILAECYPHEFVDNELVETARARHAYVQAKDSIVEHLHPRWGKAPTDALYEAEPARLAESRRIFWERKRLWERPQPRFRATA